MIYQDADQRADRREGVAALTRARQEGRLQAHRWGQWQFLLVNLRNSGLKFLFFADNMIDLRVLQLEFQ